MDADPPDARTRLRLRVTGQVQGVGFRPWVARTARRLCLTGTVHNGADGVWIEVQGRVPEHLLDALAEAPAPIEADLAEHAPIPVVDGEEGFTIVESTEDGPRWPMLPPDLATCDACLAELTDPDDRRHGYALLSCVACGPRYSIAGPPPFDRARTAMVAFPLCEACAIEYDDPTDRRYHAQATACADCGPTLSMSIADAARVLLDGGILGVKGLSGFQLLCDATDEAAVRQLRDRKRRPDKPLAVMVPDPDAIAGLTDAEGRALSAPDAPVVLCRPDLAEALAPSVSSGLSTVGLMRPSTGVHHLLLAAVGRPVVCTSANRSGAPLATTEDGAAPLADAVLDHDRPVWRGADDSVVRVLAGRARVLRRARGHAPRPLPLGTDGPPLLAVGADLKSVVGLALGDRMVLSPHLGALGSRAMHERLLAEVDGLCEVYGARPEAIACDAHPDLVSTRVAEELARRWEVPLHRVHHHHAHVAAVCAEHGLDRPVLGVAWDGVGLGPDGTVWGGELLRVDGATATRLDHLHPLALPGGDACARQPGRTALSLLHGARLGLDATLHHDAETLWTWLDRLDPACTAAGRLLDGLAVLCGLPPDVSYEAQLPQRLEDVASAEPVGAWPVDPDHPLDWRPWVAALVGERLAGTPLPVLGRRVHDTLVEALVTAVDAHDGEDIVLCGGCFQNRWLAEGAADRLQAAGRRVWLPTSVPPGDGAIALGQAWVVRRRS